MSAEVSDEIVVDAPLEVVRGVIDDIDAYPTWAEGVLEAEVLERDADGRPAAARFVVLTPMAKVGYELAYSYPQDAVQWTLTRGELLSRMDGGYRLVGEGHSTRVSCTLEVAVDLPLPPSVTRQAATKVLDRALAGVKERAESLADRQDADG